MILDLPTLAAGAVKLSYTDYIAHRIRRAFAGVDAEGILASVGRVQWDLHPEHGYFVSTKKTIEITDRNGRRYLVTIEDALP